jgi:hypothetical protein
MVIGIPNLPAGFPLPLDGASPFYRLLYQYLILP